MARGYFLNEEDREFLRRLKERFPHLVGRRENPARPRVGYDGFDDSPQAPEVYIALVPEAGIPALEPAVGTGTAGFTDGDRPGEADCQIYRVINGALESIGKSQKVWNLTESDIDEQWVTVVRDKFGTWLVQTGGGTPCEERNEVWQISITGDPLGGTIGLTFFINNTEDTISIPFDATAEEAKTAFATHSQLTSSDLNTEGGSLPDTSIRVEFTGSQAGKPIRLTSFSKSGLSNTPGTGTTGDTEGLGVNVLRWQPGFSP